MKIGFDIGGVISKYPDKFMELIGSLLHSESGEFQGDTEIYFITDMHPKEDVVQTLINNGFDGRFLANRYTNELVADSVYCADYEKYGNLAKAILIKELALDIFIDDFDGYLQWDSSLGQQPILLKVMPDAFKPYWHDEWKSDGGDFGRRKATIKA